MVATDLELALPWRLRPISAGLTLAVDGAGGCNLALAGLVLAAVDIGGPAPPLRYGPTGHGATDSGRR